MKKDELTHRADDLRPEYDASVLKDGVPQASTRSVTGPERTSLCWHLTSGRPSGRMSPSTRRSNR